MQFKGGEVKPNHKPMSQAILKYPVATIYLVKRLSRGYHNSNPLASLGIITLTAKGYYFRSIKEFRLPVATMISARRPPITQKKLCPRLENMHTSGFDYTLVPVYN